jgi:hypothetical protein
VLVQKSNFTKTRQLSDFCQGISKAMRRGEFSPSAEADMHDCSGGMIEVISPLLWRPSPL